MPPAMTAFQKTIEAEHNHMKHELLGLIGLTGVMLFLISTPEAAADREALKTATGYLLPR